MKITLKYFLPGIIMLIYVSCDKNKTSDLPDNKLVLPDSILAGQKLGQGIYYVDFEPDISVIIDPLEQQDTSFSFDLNNDNVTDYIFVREKSYPLIMGEGYDRIIINSLDANAIVVIPAPYPDTIIEPCTHLTLEWVDTLSVIDPILANMLWINNESLIYHNRWVIQNC
ncbi:MAG: hypothetical protein K8R74_06655, partial [Bacteroidales bacterium]|nr:hypothetical protein [Bacteroidales bacterium]